MTHVHPEPAEPSSDMLIWDMSVPWQDHGQRWLKDRALGRYRENGVGFVSLTVAKDEQGVQETIRQIARERAMIQANEDKYVLISNVSDIIDARKSGKLAIAFNFQGTNPFARDLAMVETYHRLGVRHALLAYNLRNAVGSGCHERSDDGLSSFGITLIREMNRVGMLVDLAHTGSRTSLDAIEHSSAPVIISHAAARSVHDHPRNIDDERIRACAESGGVMGVTGTGLFLGSNEQLLDKFIQHIDHIVQLVGPGHVGFGLDFNYDMDAAVAGARSDPAKYPVAGGYANDGLKIIEPEHVPHITEALQKRGYSDDDVRAIAGLNWLRVASQVWNTQASK